jgi:hypothetical protein
MPPSPPGLPVFSALKTSPPVHSRLISPSLSLLSPSSYVLLSSYRHLFFARCEGREMPTRLHSSDARRPYRKRLSIKRQHDKYSISHPDPVLTLRSLSRWTISLIMTHLAKPSSDLLLRLWYCPARVPASRNEPPANARREKQPGLSTASEQPSMDELAHRTVCYAPTDDSTDDHGRSRRHRGLDS